MTYQSITKSAFSLLALAFLVLAGCAPAIRVSSDFDRTANFQTFKTFGWYHETGNPADKTTYDSFLDKRIRQAIESAMLAKGFTYSQSSPDVKVAFDLRIETETRLDPTARYSYAPGFGSWGYGGWMGYGYNYGYNYMSPNMMTYNYREGTLVIDFVRASDNELVWRGHGITEVTNKTVQDENIREIVNKIFERYPPKP